MQIYQCNFSIFYPKFHSTSFSNLITLNDTRCCETLKLLKMAQKFWAKNRKIILVNLRLTYFSVKFPKLKNWNRLTNPSLATGSRLVTGLQCILKFKKLQFKGLKLREVLELSSISLFYPFLAHCLTPPVNIFKVELVIITFNERAQVV